MGLNEGDRVETAVWVRRNAVNDFFGGWEEDDIALLRRYQPAAVAPPAAGEVVDWLGIRTLHRHHPWMGLSESGSASVPLLPFPDDQVHAEAIEYVALVTALERASTAGDGTFTVMELGASYAPWAVAAGVLAKRAAFSSINLVAVEASESMIPHISQHAERNDLVGDPVSLRVVHGAVTSKDSTVYFPKVSVALDNGAQVSKTIREKDYRGLALEYEPVSGYTLKRLVEDVSRVDFMHMDIQGAEEELLLNDDFVGELNVKVSTFFLATQSRLIEGIALKRLSALNWRLLRERPTAYRQNDRTRDINGWTLRDGGQIWLNPRFV